MFELLSVAERLRARTLLGLATALILPALALLLRLALGNALTGFPFLLFFPAVLGAAFVGGWLPGVIAAMVSQTLATYFLIEPLYSFSLGGRSETLALAFFNLVCATIIVLIHALGSMVHRLATTTDALRRTNELLELRVSERTRELADANAALRAEMAARQAMERQALQTQKLEAVGQLTGGIAHDFNNMLQAVSGSLDLMRRRLAQGRPEQIGRYLDAAGAATGRAAQLTQRLLAFARRQALAPLPVDTSALVDSMSELIRRAIGPDVAVTLQLDPGLGSALCDPSQLEAALMNLALNARDAMPEGGSLTLITRRAQAPAEAGTTHAAEYVEISVSDTGVGMSQSVLAHAFEPFFTTKPIGRGTGLGLSQIYGFVRQSHGDVRIESTPGRGTTVHIYLPLSKETAPADPVRDEPIGALRSVGRASGTVMLVEDEAVVRSTSAEALRELGCEVIEAGDGPEALRLIESGPVPDVLVTDVGLPGGLNGRQLADVLRERRPGLPVFLITGYAGKALEGQLAPGMTVMRKPFPLEALIGGVQRALAAANSRTGGLAAARGGV